MLGSQDETLALDSLDELCKASSLLALIWCLQASHLGYSKTITHLSTSPPCFQA